MKTAYGICVLTMLVALANPPAARAQGGGPSESFGFGGWQVDVHVGGLLAGVPEGSGTLPGPGPTFRSFNGAETRSVSSWYLGDGSLLANQVTRAIAANGGANPPPPIVPLDGLITTASTQLESGATIGFRLGHSVTRRALVELFVDRVSVRNVLTTSALSAVEATRASFSPYFNNLLSRGANATSVSATSTAATVNGSGTQVTVGVDASIAIVPVAGFTPFVTVGGGFLLPIVDDTTVTLSGSYRFAVSLPGTPMNGAVISENDQVLVQYKLRAAPFALFGFGVQRNVSRHLGVRGELRFNRRATQMEVRLDTLPQHIIASPPFGRITRGPDPVIQFSSLIGAGVPSSLALQGVRRFTTFTGTGQQVAATIAFYARF